MKHGNIFVYGGKADPYVVNNEDYKVKVTKTWVKATDEWHIKFESESIHYHKFELFLTDDELEHLRRVL